jgi:hydroxymethylglutaryl-CoA lyase
MRSSGVRRTASTLPEEVVIREVGPRDGLQAEPPLPPEVRARLVGALFDAGLMHVEAVSFVSPKAVPAMAGAGDVLAAVARPEGATISALVPNRRGAEMALEAGVDEITVTVAVSAEYNRRNVHMSIDESLEATAEICALAAEAGVPVDAVVSCAFGSPYEGDVAPAEVAAVARRLRQAGASALTLADTTGMATPRVIEEVLATTGSDVGLHLHETRGTGLLNAYAAMQAGVRRFDTSVGGLGGSPFAEGAAGNLATEDFVALLDDLGVRSGVSLERLLEASALAERLVGHPLASRVAHVGPRLAGSGRGRPWAPASASSTTAAPFT